MYYVYILRMANKQFYVGFSSNLKRRIFEHRSGSVITTKKYLPVILIFYEAFLSEKDARRREKYFKTSKGKSTLRLMLHDYLQ